jgi:hypothetical protein
MTTEPLTAGTRIDDPDWQDRLARLSQASHQAAKILRHDHSGEAGTGIFGWPDSFRSGNITPESVQAAEEHLGLPEWVRPPARSLPDLVDEHSRRLEYEEGDRVLVAVDAPPAAVGHVVRVSSRARPEGWDATVTKAVGHRIPTHVKWFEGDECHSADLLPASHIVRMLDDKRPVGPWEGIVVQVDDRSIHVLDEFEIRAARAAQDADESYEPGMLTFRRRGGTHVLRLGHDGPGLRLIGRADSSPPPLDPTQFTRLQGTLYQMAQAAADMPLDQIAKACDIRLELGPEVDPDWNESRARDVQALRMLAKALLYFQEAARTMARMG